MPVAPKCGRKVWLNKAIIPQGKFRVSCAVIPYKKQGYYFVIPECFSRGSVVIKGKRSSWKVVVQDLLLLQREVILNLVQDLPIVLFLIQVVFPIL